MTPTVHGLHHVTCIAGAPQRNLDFYVGLMGMRLVKRSVNQDAPDTYHLFYADGAGTPGTDLTFFPWPDMGPGRLGIGLTVEVPFAVPLGSLAYWRQRLADAGVEQEPVELRFGEPSLPFEDPDGLKLALVETADERAFVPWGESPVPAEHQLRGMHAVRLWERDLAPTVRLLTEVLGFQAAGEEAGWQRFAAGSGLSVGPVPRQRYRAVGHQLWRELGAAPERALQGHQELHVRSHLRQEPGRQRRIDRNPVPHRWGCRQQHVFRLQHLAVGQRDLRAIFGDTDGADRRAQQDASRADGVGQPAGELLIASLAPIDL